MNAKLVTDTGIVFTRELRPMVRDPFTVVFGLIQPLVFLGLFAPLLTGMTGLGMAESLQLLMAQGEEGDSRTKGEKGQEAKGVS